MSISIPRDALAEIVAIAHPLSGGPNDFDDVVELAAGRQYVLIGEASHGTHEFYRIRGEITKRLIREQGFDAVAVEGDWPDAYRVNKYVRGAGDDPDASDALGGFVRFPQWMWRNADVLEFLGWLRQHNENRPAELSVGFYGLDLYSLHASIDAVLRYLRKVDPEEALRAMQRYACFSHYGGDPQRYGYATGVEHFPSCEPEVVRQLVAMRAKAADYAKRDGRLEPDDHFFAEQNAKVVVDAEQYYRAMYWGGAASWNLRDRHMAATLQSLTEYLTSRRRDGDARIVVWAHNSHLGDARATEMSRRGEINLGQLVRQSRGDKALLVGFTTYDGTVTAASDWDRPAERKRVRPALAGSYEALFHDAGLQRFFLDLHRARDLRLMLNEPRLERAIGVIYRPETERLSHYFHARLPQQFDAVFHYDRTRAVEPLERTPRWEGGEPEVPETYPTAL
jgi:erythromycin esterase-like protein